MARKIFDSKITRATTDKRGKPKRVTSEVTTAAFTQGQKLYVRGILGSTVEDLATVKELPDNHYLLIFNQDVLTTIEGLSDNLLTCKHLLFTRANRPPVTSDQDVSTDESVPVEKTDRKRPTFHRRVRLFSRLLAACFQAGRKPISVPGGLKFALAFCNDKNGKGGEMIIAAPRKGEEVTEETAGDVCIGFIVANDEKDTLLANLPPLK